MGWGEMGMDQTQPDGGTSKTAHLILLIYVFSKTIRMQIENLARGQRMKSCGDRNINIYANYILLIYLYLLFCFTTLAR